MSSVPWVAVCAVLFVCIHLATSTDIGVNFNQSIHYINENDKSVSLTIVLTKSLNSTNVTVYIGDGPGNASKSNNKSTLLYITVPAQQVSATKSVSFSATKDTLPSLTIAKLCLNDTKATGPSDANNTCSDTESVTTGPDGLNATNVTVTIGEHKQTTVEFFVKLGFSKHNYSFKESSGLAKVTLVLSKPLSSAFDLTIISAALTSSLSDKDYNPGPFHITFPAKQTSVSFNISLKDDNKVEKAEKFLLEIHNSSLPDGVKLQDHSCLVTIIDTTIAVNFNQSQYRFKEGMKLAQLVLTINKQQNVTFAVSVKITPASATDDDFNCTSHTVNFPINATSTTLNITLIDDTVYEGNESFTVTIDPSSKLPPGVTVGVTNEATVTIVDDDVVTIRFSQAAYNATDGKANIVLLLSQPLDTHPLTVHGSFESDAGANGDSPKEFSTTFKSQVNTSGPIPIKVTQNGVAVIVKDSLPDFITIGDPSKARIIVIPNPTTITPTTDTTNSTTESEGSVAATTATSTDTTKSNASDTQGPPGSAPGARTAYTNGGDFTSLFLYICIILLLILVPSAYVYHLNREKIHGCLKRKAGNRHGRIRYQLLPSSVGESLDTGHKVTIASSSYV